MTLVNSGTQVTQVTASTWQTIRSSLSKTAGKLYIEFYADATYAGTSTKMFGLASSSFDATNYLGSSNFSGGIVTGASGNQVSTGFTSHYAVSVTPAASDTWGMAVDFATGNIWLAQNNVWVNSSNPATASLPVLTFVPATVGALFAGLSVHQRRRRRDLAHSVERRQARIRPSNRVYAMGLKRTLLAGGVLLSLAASVQAQSPAQMGVTPPSPKQDLQVLDSAKRWVTISTVDPATHIASFFDIAASAQDTFAGATEHLRRRRRTRPSRCSTAPSVG